MNRRVLLRERERASSGAGSLSAAEEGEGLSALEATGNPFTKILQCDAVRAGICRIV